MIALSDLVLATDSAYPYDFAQAPAGCQVIMGYIGRPGYTPHVWTVQEANEARRAGFVWWPIVVGISQGATNAQDGVTNAQTVIAQAPAYGVTKTDPVFCDLEPDALHANPTGAKAMADAFRSTMHAAGWLRAYVYSVDAPFIDWVANWTNIRPTTLPPGKIGVQYAGNLSPPGYDLSVFDPALLEGSDMLTSDQDQKLTDLHNWLKGSTSHPNLAPGTVNTADTIVVTCQAVRAAVNDLNALLAASKSDAAALGKLQTSVDHLAAANAALPPGTGGPAPHYTGTVELAPVPPAPAPPA